jgi:low affinity Fe/Cu permease
MKLETIYKGYFLLAAMDVLLAIVCAANGSPYFAYFGFLGLIMWALGSRFKRISDQTGE